MSVKKTVLLLANSSILSHQRRGEYVQNCFSERSLRNVLSLQMVHITEVNLEWSIVIRSLLFSI